MDRYAIEFDANDLLNFGLWLEAEPSTQFDILFTRGNGWQSFLAGFDGPYSHVSIRMTNSLWLEATPDQGVGFKWHPIKVIEILEDNRFKLRRFQNFNHLICNAAMLGLKDLVDVDLQVHETWKYIVRSLHKPYLDFRKFRLLSHTDSYYCSLLAAQIHEKYQGQKILKYVNNEKVKTITPSRLYKIMADSGCYYEKSPIVSPYADLKRNNIASLEGEGPMLWNNIWHSRTAKLSGIWQDINSEAKKLRQKGDESELAKFQEDTFNVIVQTMKIEEDAIREAGKEVLQIKTFSFL